MKGSIFLAALILVAVPATTFAKTHHVPKDHETIQAAIDAAEDGDRIIVKGGTYSGKIEIVNRTDLTIRGVKKPVLDKSSVYIHDSSGITVTGLEISRSHGIGFDVRDSDDVAITRCRIRNTFGDGISALRSDGLRIEANVLEKIGSDGIDLNYDEEARDGCDDAVIRGNRITEVDSDGIEITGRGHLVTKNVVVGSSSEGINAQGTAAEALVSRNRIEDCHNGIRTHAAGSRITRNRVSGITNDGIGVQGDDVVVDRNRITDCKDDGLEVWRCEGGTFTKNRISGIVEEGIQIGEAPGGTYTKNRIKDCFDCGIMVESGHGKIEKNRIANCSHCGILMRDGGSEITKNRIKGSGEVDIWDGGPFDVENIYEKNRFGSSNLD